MSDISKINVNETEYNLKDATARADIQSSITPPKASVVTVTDAYPMNAEDITVDITPKQDLHGYSKPWAGGAGKNKLPMTVAEIKALNTGGTWSGNTYTLDNTTFEVNEDDNGYVTEIKANGTPTNNILYFRVAQNISVASPLIFSTGYTDTWEINGHVMEMAVDNTSYKPFDVSGVEIPTGTYELHIAVAAGRAINNNYKPMLRPTTVSDYSYAPYSNICPIEGWTSETVDRVGKNKLPLTVAGIKAANTGGTWSGNTYTYLNMTYEIMADSDGNVTGIQITGTPSSRAELIITSPGYVSNVYKGMLINGGTGITGSNNGIYVSYSNNGINWENEQFQTDGDVTIWNYNYINITIMCSTGTFDTVVYPMIRLASETDATYEPYQGQQYTVNFGQTVYGGKNHMTKGGTDKTMGEVVLNGSENYTVNSSGTDKVSFRYENADIQANPEGSQISNILNYHRNAWSYNAPTFSFVIGVGELFINVPKTTASTAEELKTWIASNNLQFVYELATPTTINTRAVDIPMLQGINTISASTGDVSLKYQPDNVVGELKGEIQKANGFVSKMALREGSGAKDFSYGGWSFRLYIYRSMGQISMSVERISASSVTEQAVVKVFNDESDYRAPEELRPRFDLLQAATYTTPSGWAIQVYLKDDGYIMFNGIAPEVGASAPTSSNWNLVEPWLAHQQAMDLFNN